MHALAEPIVGMGDVGDQAFSADRLCRILRVRAVEDPFAKVCSVETMRGGCQLGNRFV